MRKNGRTKMNGRVVDIGSFAIASSMKDYTHQPCIICTTFNILAPIYKRLSKRSRAAVKAITGHFGWPGINGYWILYHKKDLPSFVYGNFGLGMKS